MRDDDELYRGIVEYEVEQREWDSSGNLINTGKPDVTRREIIGPYDSVSPIKRWVTVNRNRGWMKNVRLVRFERVTGWEEFEVD